MKIGLNIARITRFLFIVFALVFCGNVAAKDNTLVNVNKPGAAAFSFDTASLEPVIVYHEVVEMIANRDEQPMLKIYADGRVQVHHPVYKKNAGDYEMQLSQQDLVSLIASLADDELMDFDTEKVKKDKQKVDKELKKQGQFFYISDSVITHIDINLKGYKSVKTNIQKTDFKKNIKLKDIDFDAKQYKNLSVIQKTANSVNRLKALLDRKELKRK